MLAKLSLSFGQKKVIRQFVFIEAPIEFVGPEAVWWGEGKWWPQDCGIKFVPTSQGELGVGSTFDLLIAGLLKQTWRVEVVNFSAGQSVERVFKKGILKGREIVHAEERANGTRVEYEMQYAVGNPVEALMWAVILRNFYEAGVKKALEALKKYCLKQMEQEGNQGV